MGSLSGITNYHVPHSWHNLTLSLPETARVMRIHYCADKEDMLRRVKAISRKGGCYYSGFVLPDGRCGFEIHRDGKVEEKFISMSSTGGGTRCP